MSTMTVETIASTKHHTTKPVSTPWGRSTKFNIMTQIGCGILICGCPIWVTLNWMALEHFNGSLSHAVRWVLQSAMLQDSQLDLSYFPKPSLTGTLMYIGWLLFQAMLFSLLPGRTSYGQRTPGGNLLPYNANGLMAWIITHLLFAMAVHQRMFSASIIAKNWQGLFVAANLYGYLLATFSFLKAHWMPSHANDRKFSGSWFYDFWMGIELNPRLGDDFDLKLFHNGRPGIVAWTLIDISFAAYQYETHGFVSNSMVLVMAFHALYVLDFFANEDWYLRTIDIAHDHFGMMLAWGDAVFLPSFYTLQTQYLARYPTIMSNGSFYTTLGIGLASYIIFRSANEQKDLVRRMDGGTVVWGNPATYIRCQYRTLDGKLHNSLLLKCGWWSEARHINYLADICLSLAMCLPCEGHGHILPFSYAIYMFILLNHRILRDEDRCSVKYGKNWQEYCRIVPWRLVPYVY